VAQGVVAALLADHHACQPFGLAQRVVADDVAFARYPYPHHERTDDVAGGSVEEW
jgi:hypothetical protein